MTILQIKSIIYKYTGIYLAHKEENEYRNSKEFYKQIKKWLDLAEENDMDLRDCIDLAIGMWQGAHRFGRPMSFLKYEQPKWFWRPIGWFDELLMVIEWDLRRLWKQLKF